MRRARLWFRGHAFDERFTYFVHLQLEPTRSINAHDLWLEYDLGDLLKVGVGRNKIASDLAGAVVHLEAAEEALADAGLAPDDIHYLNLHGTGTPLNDSMESAAVARVLGECTPDRGRRGGEWVGKRPFGMFDGDRKRPALAAQDGRIAEQGTHTELMKAEGLYSRLYG